MGTNVSLTPDLEDFARDCVESGRYNNMSEVLRAALRLLQDTVAERRAFDDMLKSVRAEARRKGAYTIGDVAKEMDEIIAGRR